MEEILYKSTRNSSLRLSASKAILKGLSEDGGLFMPTAIPKLDIPLSELKSMDYREVAYEVMKLYFSDFTEDELKHCIASAYDEKFDTESIVELVYANGAYYLELFHGATIAFKDMALSILPHLMITAARKNDIDNDIVILTATSGDTGKAALAGFDSVPGTKIIVFYPKGGVSFIQERQMVTQTGLNTCVIGIKGNFDDAQTAVKNLFADKELRETLDKKGYQFSSANSINIGRLIPQIVYYVYSYVKLLAEGKIAEGEKINITVPTGNFGNILAAYMAKRMGLPVDRLICASNENKVLYDFFSTGVYDRNRDFKLTNSPSMDILISSNLERLIYLATGEDDKKNIELMTSLKENGRYDISADMKAFMDDFYAGFASDENTLAQIGRLYDDTGYVLDTHTAVASYVYDEYRKKTGDDTKTVIASTASPYKFTPNVLKAIDKENVTGDAFDMVDRLCELSGVKVPRAVEEIKSAKIMHDKVVEVKDMKAAVCDFLK